MLRLETFGDSLRFPLLGEWSRALCGGCWETLIELSHSFNYFKDNLNLKKMDFWYLTFDPEYRFIVFHSPEQSTSLIHYCNKLFKNFLHKISNIWDPAGVSLASSNISQFLLRG